MKILIKRTLHIAQAKVRGSMLGSRHGEGQRGQLAIKCNLRGAVGKAKRRTEKAWQKHPGQWGLPDKAMNPSNCSSHYKPRNSTPLCVFYSESQICPESSQGQPGCPRSPVLR